MWRGGGGDSEDSEEDGWRKDLVRKVEIVRRKLAVARGKLTKALGKVKTEKAEVVARSETTAVMNAKAEVAYWEFAYRSSVRDVGLGAEEGYRQRVSRGGSGYQEGGEQGLAERIVRDPKLGFSHFRLRIRIGSDVTSSGEGFSCLRSIRLAAMCNVLTRSKGKRQSRAVLKSVMSWECEDVVFNGAYLSDLLVDRGGIELVSRLPEVVCAVRVIDLGSWMSFVGKCGMPS